ncbi:hypothetical protein C1T31_09010 [Hanstruepera neustonica]|uniref:Uncharacterized protein n=2 Tax=Hanstruepera neustonica TaxID=1445657 RepID=A0A2K1DYL0_9FLAO|nr:hypothetical protein C1T31_09010 [Hanstruepera neustonica]
MTNKMIKFFRKIRQNLLSENKTGKYLKYAIGEIILVVIGILIALQINNWNNDRNDRKLEKHYLAGLINDLKSDSIAVSDLKTMSNEQVRRKEKLYEYFDGYQFSKDSIAYFFAIQWGMPVGFVPNTATIDEMRSAGGVSLIEKQDIRKKIIELYNTYQEFINGDQAYYERNRFELRKLAFKIPNVFDKESLKNAIEPDIVNALKNDELRNSVMANYAFGVNNELKVLQEKNAELLKLLTMYLSDL